MADYPEDSIQCLASEWWLADEGKTLCRGALIETYVQFYSQIPLELVAERSDPTNHKTATIRAQQLDAGGRRSQAQSLPVAPA